MWHSCVNEQHWFEPPTAILSRVTRVCLSGNFLVHTKFSSARRHFEIWPLPFQSHPLICWDYSATPVIQTTTLNIYVTDIIFIYLEHKLITAHWQLHRDPNAAENGHSKIPVLDKMLRNEGICQRKKGVLTRAKQIAHTVAGSTVSVLHGLLYD